jgi:hypothetical protein
VIPSKYYGKKQRKIWRAGGGGHFKIFKHLPNSGVKNTLVTYHLITLKNNSKQVFNLYTGLEFGKHLLKYVLYAFTKLYVSLFSPCSQKSSFIDPLFGVA